MAVDISNIRRLTFCVSYLESAEAELVNGFWRDRFSPKEAFFVEAKRESTLRELLEGFSVQLKEQGYSNLSNTECILAYFVNFTEKLDETVVSSLWSLKNLLQNVFHCNVQAVIQYAYVGVLGLDSTAVQRENMKVAEERYKQLQAFENYRLCLIGASMLSKNDGDNWKAALVYLDAVRRSQNMRDLLREVSIGSFSVGFIRYGEYNEKAYKDLQAKQKKLERALGNTDSNKVRAIVEEKRNQLISEVNAKFRIDGNAQPQHPNMIVEEPKGFQLPWAKDTRKAAKNGDNSAYNEARKHTLAAVEATGEYLRTEIEKWFTEQIDKAGETLQEFFEKGEVGIKLKRIEPEMVSVLRMTPYSCGSNPKLELRYSENGCGSEIGNYLLYIKNRSIADSLQHYTEKLQVAYRSISQSDLEAEEAKLQRNLDEVIKALANQKSVEDFCRLISYSDPPESSFSEVNADGTTSYKMLLTRSEFCSVAEVASSSGSVPVYSFDEHMSEIVRFDDAPVKAVKIVYFSCDENALNQLLPEVLYG